MSAVIIRCALALVDGEERRDFCFAVDGGLIQAVDPAEALLARYPQAEVREYGSDVAVVPGFINGHSHAYQILMRGWADDLPFERWRSDALYKVVPQLAPPDVYWTFRLAFDEMLAAGITTVAEFFYLNGAGNAHAREAIRAAADSGIRLVFARTWMDADYAPDAFRESIDAARERTQALMTEFPAVHVCLAPHSLHAASPDMIREAARFAQSRDCMMHVHVAEAQYEGEETARRFDTTPIRLLERLEALNERTLAIHAIYIADDEKRLLAQTGAGVIHNPATNQYLGDGICDVCGLQALGVPMGLGTDADVSPSVIDEMRSAAYLQKIARLDGSALGARDAFDLGTRQGAQALRVNAGRLAPERFADFTVIDVTNMDPWIPLCNQIVYRSQSRDVRETYVGGRLVRARHQEPPAGAKRAVEKLLPMLHL